MKKIMLLTSVLAVLLLVGCIPPEGLAPCNAPYKQIGGKCCMDLNNNGICDSDEAPFQEEVIPAGARMGQFKAVLDSVGGYSYKYKEDTYKVSGETVKRELVRQAKIQVPEPVGPKKTTMPWVDAIYFDTTTKTAVAYCEGLDDTGERMCSGYGLWDVPVAAEYDKYYTKTPTDWIMQFLGKQPKEVKEKYRYEISGLEVTGVVFAEEGKVTILDVDPETGIVWRATVDEDGYVTEYQYADIQTGIGTVTHEYKTAPEKPVLSETGDQAIPETAAE